MRSFVPVNGPQAQEMQESGKVRKCNKYGCFPDASASGNADARPGKLRQFLSMRLFETAMKSQYHLGVRLM